MLNDQVSDNVKKRTYWDWIIIKKFSAPVVILFTVLASLSITFIIAREGFDMGVILICGLVALPVAYACVAYPKFGIVALIVIAFFINYSSRFLPEPTPIGLVMDALTYLLIL